MSDTIERKADASREVAGVQLRGDNLSGASSTDRQGRTHEKPTGSVQILNGILKTWRLNRLGDACLLLGFDPSDERCVADVLAGREALRGRDAKDRVAYLIQMRMMLSAWWQDEEVENAWLREPQKMLDGKVPMDLLREGSMENLLLVKEYIEASTGW